MHEFRLSWQNVVKRNFWNFLLLTCNNWYLLQMKTLSCTYMDHLPMQEPLNSYLDGAAIQKIWKCHFLGNISNSCCQVTPMGLKPTPKIFFENISKNTAARGGQNFGLIEGAAVLPLQQSQKFWPQISTLKWYRYAENFKEKSQTVFEQSLIYWKILVDIRLPWYNVGRFVPR